MVRATPRRRGLRGRPRLRIAHVGPLSGPGTGAWARSTDVSHPKPISHPCESCEVMIAAITTPMPTMPPVATNRMSGASSGSRLRPLGSSRPAAPRAHPALAARARRASRSASACPSPCPGGGGHEARIPRTRGALGATRRSISPMSPVPGPESGPTWAIRNRGRPRHNHAGAVSRAPSSARCLDLQRSVLVLTARRRLWTTTTRPDWPPARFRIPLTERGSARSRRGCSRLVPSVRGLTRVRDARSVSGTSGDAGQLSARGPSLGQIAWVQELEAHVDRRITRVSGESGLDFTAYSPAGRGASRNVSQSFAPESVVRPGGGRRASRGT